MPRASRHLGRPEGGAQSAPLSQVPSGTQAHESSDSDAPAQVRPLAAMRGGTMRRCGHEKQLKTRTGIPTILAQVPLRR